MFRYAQGYEADHPNIDLLKLKNFTVGKKLPDEEVVGPRGLQRIADLVSCMVPFVSLPPSSALFDPIFNTLSLPPSSVCCSRLESFNLTFLRAIGIGMPRFRAVDGEVVAIVHLTFPCPLRWVLDP